MQIDSKKLTTAIFQIFQFLFYVNNKSSAIFEDFFCLYISSNLLLQTFVSRKYSLLKAFIDWQPAKYNLVKILINKSPAKLNQHRVSFPEHLVFESSLRKCIGLMLWCFHLRSRFYFILMLCISSQQLEKSLKHWKQSLGMVFIMFWKIVSGWSIRHTGLNHWNNFMCWV